MPVFESTNHGVISGPRVSEEAQLGGGGKILSRRIESQFPDNSHTGLEQLVNRGVDPSRSL